ncbi:MAG: hypothetical protein RIE52_10990 [Balneola sp.]
MRYAFLFIALIYCSTLSAQPSQDFWSSLERICGKAYEGKVLEAPEDDEFRKLRLVMHVRSCKEKEIRIPFFAGEDRSRTWVLTMENDRIKLKHDHRHEDGNEDEITQYGGIASNHGLSNIQTFPADSFTAELIPAAASNVWWIEIEEGKSFTYNLRRLGTERYFSIQFDLTTEIETPPSPW